MTDHKREGSQHRSALEKIAKNPSLIGINGNIVGICIEKKLFDYKRGVRYTIAEPDIIFEMSDGRVIIVEYKNNGHRIKSGEAQTQLNRTCLWYGRYTLVPAEKIITIPIDGDSYPFLKKK